MPGKPANRRTKRRSAKGEDLLLWIDRWLVQISAGIVAGVWLAADIAGTFQLSQGTQAALGAFVGYALLKSKTDQKWRALELEQSQMTSLIKALERYDPTSREAMEVRRELVQLARQAQASEEEDPDDTQ